MTFRFEPLSRSASTAGAEEVLRGEAAAWLSPAAASTRCRIATIGSGGDRRGLVGRGQVRRPARTFVPLPSVDDLTS